MRAENYAMTVEAQSYPQQQPPDTGAHAEARSGIVWLASYPKSGNTWTRALLHNLVKVTLGNAEVQRINELNQFSMGISGKSPYETILGFEPTDEHRAQIAAARGQVQHNVADAVDGLVFVKTHQALVVGRGHPTINFSVTAGAVYVVRNPLDVAISYAHHLGQIHRFRDRFYGLEECGNVSDRKTGL